MSDTIDSVDPGILLVPSLTGDNTTQNYAVWYPEDGFLQGGVDREAVRLDALMARSTRWPGAMAVRITVERIE